MSPFTGAPLGLSLIAISFPKFPKFVPVDVSVLSDARAGLIPVSVHAERHARSIVLRLILKHFIGFIRTCLRLYEADSTNHKRRDD